MHVGMFMCLVCVRPCVRMQPNVYLYILIRVIRAIRVILIRSVRVVSAHTHPHTPTPTQAGAGSCHTCGSVHVSYMCRVRMSALCVLCMHSFLLRCAVCVYTHNVRCVFFAFQTGVCGWISRSPPGNVFYLFIWYVSMRWKLFVPWFVHKNTKQCTSCFLWGTC